MRTVFASLVLVGLALLSGVHAAPTPNLERYVVVSSESEARYRVGETFLGENRFNEAVGRTREIRGEIWVNRQNPSASRVGPIEVNLSTLQSDSPRRDNAIRQRWLESARYPKARFVSTEIRGAPSSYREGQWVSLRVVGNLTLREETRPVTWEARVRLLGQELRAEATTTIRMTDFGFDPPAIFGFVRAENEVKLELDLVARREAR
ncbi:MAG: YceI family protein [Armatimonadota bacterium]|nr:YceI family protein [Armatimonadota bacterium]MDR7438717.1 YceI family protein [Armatimonadota bacterium]MDR7561933.1 YceI family protein [Armatimonadota bacterium]MDR7567506.1 YceI family protein [Armatimonadota bacterium]MDR7601844.1 YceI family protein [Armatimonadota bacterium]